MTHGMPLLTRRASVDGIGKLQSCLCNANESHWGFILPTFTTQEAYSEKKYPLGHSEKNKQKE